MKSYLKALSSLILIAVLTASPCFAFGHKRTFNKLQEKQHSAMHEIVMVDRDADGKVIGGGLCTAYAIAPNVLLTAEHCNDEKATGVYIDAPLPLIRPGKVMSYTIISRTMDHQDHMLLVVSGITFNTTIVLTAHVRVPVQGERIYTWGCPGGMRDQFRSGVVMGIMPKDPDDNGIDASGDIYLIQASVTGGDSGEALFAEKDNQLIGITTFGIDGGKYIGMFAIVFTQAQLEAAGVK